MRLALHSLLAALLAISPGYAQAADTPYPQRPIRLLIPFSAGGVTDLLARAVGARLGEALGQQVVPDNRPGANGIIAFELQAKAAPDGYTLLAGGFNGLVLNPLVYKTLPYNVNADFAPVALIGYSPLIVVVHPSVPVKSIRELVDYSRANPGKLAFASGGHGNITHIAAELFMSMTGTQMTHVPYKGGGAGMQDQLSGQVQLKFDTPPVALPHVKTGRLRALAVTSRKRLTAAPEFPTIAELGYPAYEAGTWFSIITRSGTPAPVISKLNAAVQRIVALPEMRDQFSPLAIDLASGPPADLAALIQRDTARWAEVIRKAGVTLEP